MARAVVAKRLTLIKSPLASNVSTHCMGWRGVTTSIKRTIDLPDRCTSSVGGEDNGSSLSAELSDGREISGVGAVSAA